MKPLTIIKNNKRITGIADIEDMEKETGIFIPADLKEFILNYEGARIKEKYFYAGEVMHEINQVLYLRKSDLGGASIEAIWEGHKYYGFPKYIPFAIDSGGWDYNVSIEPETYGQLWVNKFDSGDDNPLEFVCISLEEFVNNLQVDER